MNPLHSGEWLFQKGLLGTVFYGCAFRLLNSSVNSFSRIKNKNVKSGANTQICLGVEAWRKSKDGK